MASGASLLTLRAISYNRFLGICYPTKQNLRMGRVSIILFSIATWTMSTSCMLPGMISLKYEPKFKSCIWNWGPINGFAYSFSTLLLGTALPTMFLVMTFLAIVVKSREVVPMDDETMNDIRILRMPKAEKMLGILIIVYLVCWFPFLLTGL